MKHKIIYTSTRISLGILAIVIVILIGAWGYDRYASLQALSSYPPPGEFVKVQDQNMHYLCKGSNEPTLVLLHGYAGGAIDWLPLMEELAKTQRVCAFDRFGSDYSDVSEKTETASDVVGNLHQALEQLGISKPVVVGHSLGGAFAQLYAATHPVEGVILVDGLSADIANEVTQRLGSYHALRFFAQLGLLRPLASSFVHPAYTGELKTQMIALRSRSSAIVAFAKEGAIAKQGLTKDVLNQAEQDMASPLLIVAAGETDVPEGEAFRDALVALANRYPRTTYHEIDDANHYLIASHSSLIANYIETWLSTVQN